MFVLYVLREETKTTLNLTLERGELPASIIVQRKTSNDISEYNSFKEFTADNETIYEFPEVGLVNIQKSNTTH